MTGLEMMEAAKQRRESRGGKLTWFIPAEGREYTAHAASDAQRQTWLDNARSRGWRLISNPKD